MILTTDITKDEEYGSYTQSFSFNRLYWDMFYTEFTTYDKDEKPCYETQEWECKKIPEIVNLLKKAYKSYCKHEEIENILEV